jgi:outer membrane biosynthesis protein TonB
MSKEKADKKEKSEKPKTAKPQKQAQLGEEKKPKKEKAAKPAADAAAEKEAPKEEKPKPAPRPPADLRLKVLKKFYGKFLPRGPLRDRHKALMTRWSSGEDHGGVTLEELKSLYEDWKASREKPPRKVAASV